MIPPSAVNARRPSSVWADIFAVSWGLTIVVAVLVLIAPPVDLFVDADKPFVRSIGWGDRIANTVAVVLIQNVVLAFILLATHLTRLLEGIAASVKEEPALDVPSHPSAPAPAAMKGSVSARPATDPMTQERDRFDWEGSRWECSSCGAPNGLLDRWGCWRCKTPKPEPAEG